MAEKRLNTDFRKIIMCIPEDKRFIATKLINELIFMDETMAALKNDIAEHGAVEHFVQGKQNFLRESPALKSYNAMIQRYSTLYKQLSDLMNKTVDTQKNNGLIDFLKGN